MKDKKIGQCHICLKNTKLTADHVPPKSCDNTGLSNTTFKFIFYEKHKTSERKILSQNGVKFYSICENCNNNLLGSNYDKALAEFADKVKFCLRSRKPSFKIKIKINKICRDICAKFLAINPDVTQDAIDKAIRDYVLDPSAKNIMQSKLFVRIFPYENEFFFARNQIPFGRNGFLKMCSCINFYPVAFLLTTDSQDYSTGGFASIEENKYTYLLNLFDYTTGNIDDEIEIDLSKYSMFDKLRTELFSPYFPLEKYSMLLATEDSVFANTKKFKP